MACGEVKRRRPYRLNIDQDCAFAPTLAALFASHRLNRLDQLSGRDGDFIEQAGLVVSYVPDCRADRVGAHQPRRVRPQDHPPQFDRLGFALPAECG
jgi:hypothetical protein